MINNIGAFRALLLLYISSVLLCIYFQYRSWKRFSLYKWGIFADKNPRLYFERFYTHSIIFDLVWIKENVMKQSHLQTVPFSTKEALKHSYDK